MTTAPAPSDQGGPELRSSLQVRDVRKHFGPILANDGVNAEFRLGQVHALLGENGAGKSTLIKILSGIYEADGGEILLDGRPVQIRSTADARASGIAVVHQHSALIGRLTVAENIALAHDGLGFPRKAVVSRFTQAAADLGFTIDPRRTVESLSVGDRQRVEIVREMMTAAKVLILDEPTATLAPSERDVLFATLRRLADLGSAVILVTHRLEEAALYCDAVTVLRAGRTVFEHEEPSRLSQADLVRAMVGDVRLVAERHTSPRGEIALSAAGVRSRGPVSGMAIEVAQLTVRSGEILGIAGVEGNGQSDLAEMLSGAVKPDHGSLLLHEREIGALPGHERTSLIAYVPDDESLGFSVNLRVWENLSAEEMLYRRPPTAGNKKAMRARSAELVERFNIRPPSIDAVGGQLSGGNRRRVQIAREFSKTPSLVVCGYATRGLDVQSIQQVKNWCRELANGGAAVVYIASDLEEILDLSDSVAVLARGRLTASRPAVEATTEWIGHAMLSTETPSEQTA
ncbi:MAG: ABC-type uncharacterized transport system, ATPase component [Naasia sp.]|jgi:ABC-type uncharacterized transport system ATPase subunit|uniref:ABC transporter ATP-binding protein n=1 Tax=Naasia sp. TaxID=2546198 RepID=UPI00260CF802|nr:ATP-binding cassette domain-containing protein [Naasia sp.]MCU1570427.1 ABC-type uncharacterized transport system, ATPase component [Naasia sp.]